MISSDFSKRYDATRLVKRAYLYPPISDPCSSFSPPWYSEYLPSKEIRVELIPKQMSSRHKYMVFYIGEKWFLNYLYQQWYSVLLNIIGVPFSTLPVNMYIIHSSLSSFPITLKYHSMFFTNIETHKPFASDFSKPFQFIQWKEVMNCFSL